MGPTVFCTTFLAQLLTLAGCSNAYDINLGLLTHKVLPLKSLFMSQDPMEHKSLLLQKKVTLVQYHLQVMLEVISLCTILPQPHCIYLILNKHKPPHYMICFCIQFSINISTLNEYKTVHMIKLKIKQQQQQVTHWMLYQIITPFIAM